MESVISIIGKSFGIIAVDTCYFKSILSIKKDLNKIIEIGPNIYTVVSGYPGDVAQFTDLVQKSIQLHALENGIILDINSIANFMRSELSFCLRKGPLKINLILIGFDIKGDPSLYLIDYLGNLQKMNFCAQGYSSLLIYSLLEKYFEEKIHVDQAIQIITKCISTIRSRFLVHQNGFLVKAIYKKSTKLIGIF